MPAAMSNPDDPGRPEWADRARRVAHSVRRGVLAHTLRNDGGYLSQACSSAEVLATLYTRVMRLGPSEGPAEPRHFPGAPGPGNPAAFTGAAYNGPRAPDLDRFVFSPVHYALVLYSVLIEVGRLGRDALDHFNRDGSTLELIGAEHSPGHEVTAGSLGQALSQACGIALARRLRREPGRVWVFMSDGELQEGQTWEAVSMASHYRLDSLGVLVDANGQQCDGAMRGVMTVEPIADRLRAFGAEAREVDGHDVAAIAGAAEAPHPDRPLVVVCRTDPCRGIDLLRERGGRKLHYVRFTSLEERERYEAALAAWSEDPCRS
jgi:transketolase